MRFDPRLSRLIRLAGIGLITWTVFSATDHPGTSGRALAVSMLLAVALVCALIWIVQLDLLTPLGVDTYLLAIAGGGLVGASPQSAASVFVFVAVVSAALRADLARAWPVCAAGVLAFAASVIIWDESALGLLAYSLGFAAAGLAASNARQFRTRADQAELLLAQTQRSHEEQLRTARLEESTRIAREIHDVLAHSLAGLAIQLEATTALVEKGADRDAILERVRRAHELAREGLRETRRAVGALRGDATSVPEAIEALAAAYRSADERPAALTLTGDVALLRGDPGQAVLRVVQEALTNVTKHARGAEVMIEIDARADQGIAARVENRAVQLAVAAPGGGSLAASGGGYGLRGMRERAAAVGGTLEAGPADGGWRVLLRVPAEAAGEHAPGAAVHASGPDLAQRRSA